MKLRTILALVFAFMVYGCGGQTVGNKTETKKISFFAWDGIDNYPKVKDQFTEDINCSIYLSPVDKGDGSKFAINAEDVQNQGATVWMLISGDLNEIYPDDKYLAGEIDKISNFNSNNKDKIKGIVFDIEPWSKFEDQNSSVNQDEWKRYLAKIEDYKDKLHKQNLKMSVVMPFWLHYQTEAEPYGRPIDEEIIDMADQVVVMDYTVFLKRVYPQVEHILEYSDAHNKKVVVAYEMTKTDEKSVSLYGKSSDFVNKFINIIPKDKHKSFDGYAFHTLDSFADSNVTLR